MAQMAKVALVIDENTVAINRGGHDIQMTPNQTWFVRRTPGTAILDPDTGQQLGMYGQINAWLTVVNVFSHFCICVPTDNTVTYTKGDVLEVNYDGPNAPQTT